MSGHWRGALGLRGVEPRLETARLVLRPYGVADAGGMASYLADYEVSRWLALVPHPYLPRHAAEFLARKLGPEPDPAHFGLAIEIGGRFAGGLSLSGTGWSRMLGYWIGRPYWGQGYMTEAVAALLDHAFGPMSLDRIGSGVFVGNAASLAIQKRFGFEILGESQVFSVARNETITHIDTLLTRQRYRETSS
ncbi:GNAT family N-acetyltransferase [Prosthecomicrobium sp. N25]|uniref:GNAT family N-acetyltransferase n=1 Tax=Prosthecomicrobium sp. N25 TaxID=3129254 RepID=UPI003077AE00